MDRAVEDGTPLSGSLRLHANPDYHANAMREWVNTVFIVVLMIVLIPITLWVKAINDDLAATQAAQAVSSQKFERFLQNFTAEQNYECTVLWYLNERNVTLPHVPPSTICQVTAP